MSKKNPKNLMDPIWTTYMKTLTERKKQIEISETITKAISDWYIENGTPEPNWRFHKDPDWWIKYLQELDNLP
jgi:hypothetical protein